MTEQRDLGDIAHDVRGALSVIRLTTEAVQAREPDSKTEEDLESIVRHVDKVSALIDELIRAKKTDMS